MRNNFIFSGAAICYTFIGSCTFSVLFYHNLTTFFFFGRNFWVVGSYDLKMHAGVNWLLQVVSASAVRNCAFSMGELSVRFEWVALEKFRIQTVVRRFTVQQLMVLRELELSEGCWWRFESTGTVFTGKYLSTFLRDLLARCQKIWHCTD